MKDLNLDFQEKEKKKYIKKKKEVRVQLDDNYYSILQLIAVDEFRTVKATAEKIILESIRTYAKMIYKKEMKETINKHLSE